MFAAFLLVTGPLGCKKQTESGGAQGEFVRLMNTGKNYLDQGQAQKALESYQRAVKLAPADPDVHLNLANAYLLANNPEQAIRDGRVVTGQTWQSHPEFYREVFNCLGAVREEAVIL